MNYYDEKIKHDPEKYREYLERQRRYYRENKERYQKYGRDYYHAKVKTDPEKYAKVKLRCKMRAAKNREYSRKYAREQYQRLKSNPEKYAQHLLRCRLYSQKRYRSHPDIKSYGRSKLLKHYGLTTEQYAAMLQSQGGGCAICGARDQTALAVDHNHKTGKVRGLLCRRCNFLIGAAKEASSSLIKVITYLRSHP